MTTTTTTGAVPAVAPACDDGMGRVQRALAAQAVRRLRAAGFAARAGMYGEHATAEAATDGGWLVLVPMGDAAFLDAAVAAEDGADLRVWHVHARAADGSFVEAADPVRGCPSLLWTPRAGLSPDVSVAIASAAARRGLPAPVRADSPTPSGGTEVSRVATQGASGAARRCSRSRGRVTRATC